MILIGHYFYNIFIILLATPSSSHIFDLDENDTPDEIVQFDMPKRSHKRVNQKS